jgi:hypothetical protein
VIFESVTGQNSFTLGIWTLELMRVHDSPEFPCHIFEVSILAASTLAVCTSFERAVTTETLITLSAQFPRLTDVALTDLALELVFDRCIFI